ncbi:MAG: hypothetical protein JST21_04250 [Bacteroidetes bacterium]|nr:hypothetical protein [Bacteroidota bacterium]
MIISLRKWFRVAVFNLLLVSVLGIIMRYKIAFSLPFINQKYFLEAHSHFAFSGWVTQALMVLIATYIEGKLSSFSLKKYNRLFFANLITAFGMLISFPLQGYGLISIIFSTLSIFVSYAFAFTVWNDLKLIQEKSISHLWIKSALIFNVISSAGPYILSYMLVTNNIVQHVYLASTYFYLHFQYNGWFFFTCMGLLSDKLNPQQFSEKLKRNIFYAFFFASIPAYFLSALWLPIPTWLYIIIVLAAFTQISAWVVFLVKLFSKYQPFFEIQPKIVTYLLTLSSIALSIKLLLQLISTIPALSTWAFGFRPIVIGYLHLIFLGVFSIFILSYGLDKKYYSINKKVITGSWIFVTGIILNELILMLQGLDAIVYTNVPYEVEALLTAAIIMFTGLMILVFSQTKEGVKIPHEINH